MRARLHRLARASRCPVCVQRSACRLVGGILWQPGGCPAHFEATRAGRTAMPEGRSPDTGCREAHVPARQRFVFATELVAEEVQLTPGKDRSGNENGLRRARSRPE